MFVDHIDRLEAQLVKAPVRDVADVLLDVLGGHARHRPHLEGQIDEVVFETHGGLANIGDVVAHRLGQAAALLGESMEHLDDALAVQRFVADRPGDDLPHALHLVEARKVHQHGKAGEELHALGETAEHGQRARDVLVAVNAEVLHVVMLVLQLGVLEECAVFALGHADRVEQVRIGRDVHRLHVGEGGEHHLDFGRLENARVLLVVAVLHFHVGLREKAEDLREQVALVLGKLLRPVAAVLAQRHFLRQPVQLLLALPVVVGPGVLEWLVGLARVEKGHGRLTPMDRSTIREELARPCSRRCLPRG